MTRRLLPTGMTSLREIRELDCYYVDKTHHVRRLAERGKFYFMSRPRRFGKSLLVDTMQELFEGSEKLFRGLDIHGQWDWSARHPVLRLDFSGRTFTEPGHLEKNLAAQLDAAERRAGIEARHPDAPERFAHLIAALHERAGQRAVVLVDEQADPGRARQTGTGARQPRFPARTLFGHQVQRQAAPFRFPDGGE